MIDTGCDLPQEYIDKHGIKSIPIPFRLDGVPHDQGRWQEISGADFYKALREGSVASTALINPESFVQVFTKYAKRGEALLSISLSSGLSGTYQNSLLALDEVKEAYPDCNICSVDSLNAAVGIGLLTVLAVRKRDEGLSVQETAKWLEEIRHSCFSLFTVDDLMFLHRGGRVSKLQAIAGSIIGVKPLLNIAPDGTLKLKDKARGRKGSIEALLSHVKRCIKPGTASLDLFLVGHCDCEEDAQMAVDLVKSSFSVQEVMIETIGPVIGAHSGPGTIALFFVGDMNRDEYEKKYYPEK